MTDKVYDLGFAEPGSLPPDPDEESFAIFALLVGFSFVVMGAVFNWTGSVS